jgi:ABC-type sugar transport system permease subunit
MTTIELSRHGLDRPAAAGARVGLRRLTRVLAILLVTLLTAGLHLRAVEKLPIDFDEDDYLLAAQHYSQDLAAGNWRDIINWDYNFEHPPLTKLLYGVALLPLPAAPPIPQLPVNGPPADSLPQPHFTVDRLVSSLFGTLEVVGLALLNPLAGLFLGINTWQLKYTSQVMLEPLPALTSALAVLFYLAWRRPQPPAGRDQPGQRGWPGWLALSAAAMGVTAAGKYTYCVAGLAILADWLWLTFPPRAERSRARWVRWLLPVLGWGLLVVVVFVAADPRMWSDGLNRVKQSVLYHASYAESQHVQDAGYPTWQPFVWLSGPVPWHPGVFVFMLDLYISLLAAAGFRRLWQRQRVMGLWLVGALAFLTVWPTKWPQYILILLVPLSLAAAEGFAQWIGEPVAARLKSGWRWPRLPAIEPARWRDLGRALPWLLPGLAALLLIVLFPLVYQAAMALTDLSVNSLRDGLQGGVWREVWRGLTGQVQPVALSIFGDRPGGSRVQYAGFGALVQLFEGLSADVLFFNIMWVVLAVGAQFVVGAAAALLLQRSGARLRGWWRAILLLPWAIPEFVGSIIWVRMFDPDLGWLHLALPQLPLPNYQKDQNFALVVLLIAATWYGFPLIMLAMSAGLSLLPREVYDAAALDGAHGWSELRHITWPMVLPLLAPALILRIIFTFNQFYLFYAINPPGSLYTFSSISFFFFDSNYGFGGQFGFSAALNIFTVVVLIVLILWFNARTRAAEGVTYA